MALIPLLQPLQAPSTGNRSGHTMRNVQKDASTNHGNSGDLLIKVNRVKVAQRYWSRLHRPLVTRPFT